MTLLHYCGTGSYYQRLGYYIILLFITKISRVTVYLLAFSVPFLLYWLLACQPVDLRTGLARDGRVSSTSWGLNRNQGQPTSHSKQT